ncbi:MAG: hypothetical protein HY698_19160 [Deltaproteobacteria bacterium]|nr:hypothetical protein [Deltaproteobacteria bacterium]
MATCERKLMDWALTKSTGNQVQAAEILQMSRTTLRSRLAVARNGHSGTGED